MLKTSGLSPPSVEHGAERRLVLDGAHNVRDLGGIRTASGRMVRRERIFRSDYPAFADLDEGEMVRRLGLRTVVDLRRGIEAASECVDWERHGVRYYRSPLTAAGTDSWHAGYPAYLEGRPETVVAAVTHVAEPAGHPVLFHCAAGKDRTGVVAALVLALLGVDRAQIVDDYMLSGESVGAVLGRLIVTPPYDAMLADATSEAQQPRAEYMESLLDWIDVRGGAEAWLTSQGLPRDVMDDLREALTEPLE